MPLEQTITIINNSGKIISTGKHLVNIFKEAKLAYREKKEALKQERAGNSFRRAHTFHGSRGAGASDYHGPIYEDFDDGESGHGEDGYRPRRNLGYASRRFIEGSRRSLPQNHGGDDDADDRRSYRSLESRRHRHRLRRSNSSGGGGGGGGGSSRYSEVGGHGWDGGSQSGRRARPTRPPLTASNLRTHSEVTSTVPSVVPKSYRGPDGNHIDNNRHPYAASAPRDMVVSRLALNDAGLPPPLHPPSRAATTVVDKAETGEAFPPSSGVTPRTSLMVHRPRSDPALLGSYAGGRPVAAAAALSKPVDMHLAYGDIPPDLGSRVDLDPLMCGDVDGGGEGENPEQEQKAEAQSLVDRIENLLNEAQCIHHTAASIIAHLQNNPEAAAAVALTLAELSAVLAKISPAFLGVVKGGSPAVFALLASPQFLIGTSIAVGVTVIIFGGWKIIRRMTEIKAARADEKQAFEMAERNPPTQPQPQLQQPPDQPPRPSVASPNDRAPTVASEGVDEALVLEAELSAIETWRRGIVPSFDGADSPESWNGTEADLELISPEAMRSRIFDDHEDRDDDRRTLRSVRSRYTSRSHGETGRNHHPHRHHHRHHHDPQRPRNESRDSGRKRRDEPVEVPDRKSSRSHADEKRYEDQNTRQDRDRDHDRDRNREDRYRTRAASDAGSVSTSRSSQNGRRARDSASRVTDSKVSGGTPVPGARSSSVYAPSDAGTARSRDKTSSNTTITATASTNNSNNNNSGSSGGNMLKQLFRKKKDKEDKDDNTTVSVSTRNA
ncbi:hypothetical protein SPI_05620 [Niveomyces insectorum RCEF 264]|uniref:Uncharacterized protein n=1 Tax=Niveomyces insectorum RCEF 264 TaxID=1081102 RepID=A0A167TDN0_9HYPO|nr:hypothetical protein SPI_05620 [Niveomyces insectorum RCEF 264]